MNLRAACWTIGWLGIVCGADATADVLSVNVVNSVPGDALPGYVTNDFLLNFDGILRGQQMFLELTQGSIFQGSLVNSDTAPSSELVAHLPDLQYDSYVTAGAANANTSAPVLVVGGAVDLAVLFGKSGSRRSRFDTGGIDIAWAPAPGTNIVSGIDFLTSRVTLSNDAQGTLRYLGSTSSGSEKWIGESVISNGLIGQLTRTVFEPPSFPMPPISPSPPIEPAGAGNIPAPQLPTSSGVLGVKQVHASQIDAGDLVPGYVPNDIRIDYEGVLRGQQLVLELTQGSIFQGSYFGSDIAPSNDLISLVPEVAFDTFLTVGGATAEESAPVLVVGGAADLMAGGGRGERLESKFDAQGLNIAWAPAPGTHLSSAIDFLTSRITLSSDAQGTLRYFGSTSGGSEDWVGGAPILNGAIGEFVRDVIARPVDPIASDPPVEEEPIVNPLPQEPPLEFPPIVVEGPQGESEADHPREGLPTEIIVGGWTPPDLIDLPIRTMLIDPSQYLHLIDLIDLVRLDSLDYTLYDSDMLLGDRDGLTLNSAEKAIFYSRALNNAIGTAAFAYGQAYASDTASVPEPSSQIFLLGLATLAVRSRRRG